MKNKINSINVLLKAFETRNDQLHEEIRKNEEAIAEMQAELRILLEDENSTNEFKGCTIAS